MVRCRPVSPLGPSRARAGHRAADRFSHGAESAAVGPGNVGGLSPARPGQRPDRRAFERREPPAGRRPDVLAGWLAGAQDRIVRGHDVSVDVHVCLGRDGRAHRPGHRRPGLCPGGAGLAEEPLWLIHPDCRPPFRRRGIRQDRRSRGGSGRGRWFAQHPHPYRGRHPADRAQLQSDRHGDHQLRPTPVSALPDAHRRGLLRHSGATDAPFGTASRK